jgi:hypothetical protein
MTFQDNKYSRIYYALIDKRCVSKPEGYSENHHIIPKSLGGDNSRSNLVFLTAREHFIAHALLTRMTIGDDRNKMLSAMFFLKGKGLRKEVYINGRLYENLKKAYSASRKGVKLSPEHVEKVRQAIIGTKHPPRTEQWKQLQHDAHVGRKDPNNPNRIAAHTGANNPRAKTWNLERKDGSTFQVVALKTWCRENGYNFDHLTRTKVSRQFVSGLRILG